MVKDYVVPILVALIGLAGTLAGVWIGYRKWAEDKRAAASKGFRLGRQGAYQQLWAKVEQLNVDARIEQIPQQDYAKRIAEINAFMLTSSVYLDDADRNVVNSYIRAARRFHEVVRACEIEGANVELGDTANIPPEVLEQSRALWESQKSALALREALLQKVCSVVSGAA
jgi:hypothetical protein